MAPHLPLKNKEELKTSFDWNFTGRNFTAPLTKNLCPFMLCFLTTFSQSLYFSCQWEDDYCTLNCKNQLRYLNMWLGLSRCFQDTFLYAMACLNGSFCPINTDFYDRHPSVDLRVLIHLGTRNSSHLQTTSQLPGPKKYLKNGLLWYWLGWAAAEVEHKPCYPGILNLTDPSHRIHSCDQKAFTSGWKSHLLILEIIYNICKAFPQYYVFQQHLGQGHAL